MNRLATFLLLSILVSGCEDRPTSPLASDPAPLTPFAVGEHGVGPPLSIVFHSDRTGNREIFLMNPDGSGIRQVTQRPATSDFYPDISPDGRWIVFTSVEGSGPGDIYLIGIDGSGPMNLTHTPSEDENWARWSPSGEQIAFHRGSGPASELYLLDLASGIETRLTDNAVDDMWPEWSPDGKRLAFRRFLDIHVMDLRDPDNPVRLTTHPSLDQMAAWSQDGKRLAFMSFRAGYCSVFIMDANGENQANLTPGAPGWCSRAPSWTRNGRILFMSSRPGTLGTAVFVMDADGANPTLLTDTNGEDGGPTAR